MSNEFNQILSIELSEMSSILTKALQENGNYNAKGIASLLQLASCMLSDMSGGMPNDEDHKLATDAIRLMQNNPRALISVLASTALAFAMNHYGLMKGVRRNGSV